MKITAFADPRDAVATLAARERTSLASLSRMLGQDPRYLGRYVRERRPRQLEAREQQVLADHFGADPRDFGAPDTIPTAAERALASDRVRFAGLLND